MMRRALIRLANGTCEGNFFFLGEGGGGVYFISEVYEGKKKSSKIKYINSLKALPLRFSDILSSIWLGDGPLVKAFLITNVATVGKEL